jgi:uncharacterized cupin superfamily protein
MSLPFTLLANRFADASALPLAYVDMPLEQVISGNPRVGTAALGELGECRIGVWEISPSISTDVECDEFFIVLFGLATVAFADGRPALRLRAGSVGRLAAGAVTTWTVSETLRKVYIV